MSAPAKPMGANSPTSRAGTRSRKPTASLALMAGAGRRLNPAASSPEKTVVLSLLSISPGCGFRSMPMARPSFAKVTASGEGRGPSPGEVHDTALKAAETDATKRALATFGRPFGLALYRERKGGFQSSPATAMLRICQTEPRVGLHPDDTTPIPRPSHYYGRRQDAREGSFQRKSQLTKSARPAPPLVPARSISFQTRSTRANSPFAEPKRLRDKAHLKFVASQPCLICGRQPSDPHHLRFAQPRAIGLKVSDEFTVPLCRGHHRQLHQAGNEVAWWENLQINALEIAKDLWEQTHSKDGRVDQQTQSTTMPMPAKQWLRINGYRQTNYRKSTKCSAQYWT